MTRAAYPFAAIVGQEQMKLALLLAAVDWKLSVLLRGDKGSGKTTTARGLAALLPAPAPFLNLPIGATEDRLLGGLHLERALQGEPVLKPGLLSQAHGGVLYVDEINLLPAHLGDALLDTAASGVHVVEREGFSATHAAEFILLGSMNPEEGKLRPQMLDRFALSVDILATVEPDERQVVVERRLEFERNPQVFAEMWSAEQEALGAKVIAAREALPRVLCSSERIRQISVSVCEAGVRSIRADLAVVRATTAYAALIGDPEVEDHHVSVVLPLVLAHRSRERGGPTRPPMPPPPPPPQQPSDPGEEGAQGSTKNAADRIFAPREVSAPVLHSGLQDGVPARGASASVSVDRGVMIRTRAAEQPLELDVRATLTHAVLETGSMMPRRSDLQERVRQSRSGTRFLFVIDSSGSHAVQERMRLVKGAVSGLLGTTFKRGDEVAILLFRGTSAHCILEPTGVVDEALAALEYVPTGGRTPLAHALELAREYVTEGTLLVLLTDGRANVPLRSDDAWRDALEAARKVGQRALVIDTERATHALGQAKQVADAMQARYVSLADFMTSPHLDVD